METFLETFKCPTCGHEQKKMMSEKERLAFLIKRDGLEKALSFAADGIRVYLLTALERSTYKESVSEYVRFLREHGESLGNLEEYFE